MKIVQLRLNDIQQGMLIDLKARLGFNRNTDILEEGLRRMWKTEMPPDYVNKPKVGKDNQAKYDKTSNEDYCNDVLGGTVMEDDGQIVCQVPYGDLMRKIPLSSVKAHKPEK